MLKGQLYGFAFEKIELTRSAIRTLQPHTLRFMSPSENYQTITFDLLEEKSLEI
jgi:hypothetical protein